MARRVLPDRTGFRRPLRRRAAAVARKPAETVVRGQILYRGEPVSGGLVVFTPNVDRGSDGPVVTATLNADGSFTLTGDDGKPVAAGWYRIAVAPKPGSIELPTAQRPYPGIPAKYRNPGLSGLTAEVKAGTDNVICFDSGRCLSTASPASAIRSAVLPLGDRTTAPVRPPQ